MAYRYTNTDKWNDAWFSKLNPNEKLLFIYLYENCDMAGFIELNEKRWCVDIGLNAAAIKGALKGLGRGLKYSISNDCIYVTNFLKHQKNLPLIPDKNPAHRGIIKRFEEYRNKFQITDINKFIEGAMEGLGRGLGNGNGNICNNTISNITISNNTISNKTDQDKIVDYYHIHCEKMSKISFLSDTRRGTINARIKDTDYDTVLAVIKKAGQSDFLNGKNNRLWKADFDWIMRPNNFAKILEGKYDNRDNDMRMI